MSDEFNPNATDGDGDGFVQDGTKWERPVEDVAENPVVEEAEEAPAEEPTETVVDDVIKSDEPAESQPAVTSVSDGVIGSGSAAKKKTSTKKKSAPAEAGPVKVAIYSGRNMSWTGVGKVYRGYNIVTEAQAEKWLSLGHIRLATPEEVKAEFGKELNS